MDNERQLIGKRMKERYEDLGISLYYTTIASPQDNG